MYPTLAATDTELGGGGQFSAGTCLDNISHWLPRDVAHTFSGAPSGSSACIAVPQTTTCPLAPFLTLLTMPLPPRLSPKYTLSSF